MPVSDVKRLLCASLAAEILLEGRTDRAGQPLIEHSRRVMVRCAQAGLSNDQRIAAVLHDTVEEHDEPTQVLWLIETLFGPDVSRMVDYLTRRPGCPYTRYIYAMTDEPDAVPVKLEDIGDNLDPSRGPIPDSLRNRYEWAREYLLSVQPPTEKETGL